MSSNKLDKNPDKNIDLAVRLIGSTMKRNKLTLGDVFQAVNRLVDAAVEQTVLQLRSEGNSIRKIARIVHVDDSRVSAIIKAGAKCAKCAKKCKK